MLTLMDIVKGSSTSDAFTFLTTTPLLPLAASNFVCRSLLIASPHASAQNDAISRFCRWLAVGKRRLRCESFEFWFGAACG